MQHARADQHATRIGAVARGFTLVEVLVALVIVGLGMAALLGTLTSAADSTVYLRDKTFAQWIALNRIAESRLQRQPPSLGKTEGNVDYAGRKWHWQQEVLSLEAPGLLRLDVRVRPADAKATVGREAAWLATVSGVRGNAVASGVIGAVWDQLPAAQSSRPPGQEGGPVDGQDNGPGNAHTGPVGDEHAEQ